MSRKWTPEFMRDRFPAIVREQLLEQGEDPHIKPTHKWLRKNGHRQFLRRARELGYTPDEFLVEECGFERESESFPCDDPELQAEVEEWLKHSYSDKRDNHVIAA